MTDNPTHLDDFHTDEGYPVDIMVKWESKPSPFTRDEIDSGYPARSIVIHSCVALIAGTRITAEILPQLTSSEKEKIVERLKIITHERH